MSAALMEGVSEPPAYSGKLISAVLCFALMAKEIIALQLLRTFWSLFRSYCVILHT